MNKQIERAILDAVAVAWAEDAYDARKVLRLALKGSMSEAQSTLMALEMFLVKREERLTRNMVEQALYLINTTLKRNEEVLKAKIIKERIAQLKVGNIVIIKGYEDGNDEYIDKSVTVKEVGAITISVQDADGKLYSFHKKSGMSVFSKELSLMPY